MIKDFFKLYVVNKSQLIAFLLLRDSNIYHVQLIEDTNIN